MKSTLVAAFAGAVLFSVSAAPTAHATTVDFSFLLGGSPVAEGSFSYLDGAAGVLGYGDLTSFSVQFDALGVTYDQTFVTSVATQFVYFAYNATSNIFNVDVGNDELFGAIDPSFLSGFFFTPPPPDTGVYSEYSTPVNNLSYDTFTYSVVPGPIAGAGLPGLILAVGGLLGWRLGGRRTSAVKAYNSAVS